MAEGEDIIEETATLKKIHLMGIHCCSVVRATPTATAGSIGCFTAKIKKKKDHFRIIQESPHLLKTSAKQCVTLVARSVQFQAAVLTLSGHERSQP